jgi:hypothetical protein
VLVPALRFRAGSCQRTHYHGLCGWSCLSSLSGSSSGRLLFVCSRTSSWGWSVLSLLLLVEGSRLPLHLFLVVRLFLVLRLGLVLLPDCLFSCCHGFSCSALKGGRCDTLHAFSRPSRLLAHSPPDLSSPLLFCRCKFLLFTILLGRTLNLHHVTRLEVCIRVYSTRRTSVCAKDSNSLAPTAKWGLLFILEWSELYELRPELYEPLIGAGWLQETSGRPVKLRVVRLANLRLTAATALQYEGNSPI